MREGKKKSQTIRLIFWSIVGLLVATIVLCIIFYPTADPYRFFGQAISSLGHIDTPFLDIPNPSRWVFTAGFCIIAIGTLIIIIGYMRNKAFYGRKIKIIILFLMFFGAIGIVFPGDHPNSFITYIHFVGAGLFIIGFGVFNFTAQTLRYIRKHAEKPTDRKRKFDYYLDLTFVILTFIVVFWNVISSFVVMIILKIEVYEWWGPLNLVVSQKILLFVACISSFLLDLDDM